MRHSENANPRSSFQDLEGPSTGENERKMIRRTAADIVQGVETKGFAQDGETCQGRRIYMRL